jgi:hypothetical protein
MIFAIAVRIVASLGCGSAIEEAVHGVAAALNAVRTGWEYPGANEQRRGQLSRIAIRDLGRAAPRSGRSGATKVIYVAFICIAGGKIGPVAALPRRV